MSGIIRSLFSKPQPPLQVPVVAIPAVLITRQALHEMSQEVLRHENIETAGGLYGIVIGRDCVIVTGVIRPSSTEITRSYAEATLGGQHMADAVRWLHANDSLVQKFSKTPRVGRFAFLYKWHSHHKLGYEFYSATDTSSILEAVEEHKMEVALGPLAFIKETGWRVGPFLRTWSRALVFTQKSRIYFKFYYLDRAMVNAGIREPIQIEPKVVDVKEVPMLPPLGWQFDREDDFTEQLRHLEHYGCKVQMIYRDVDGKPPYEIQFIVANQKWGNKTLVIITGWDYPKSAPVFKVISPAGTNPNTNNEFPNAQSLSQGPLWNPGEDFIEAIWRLEARGEL